MTSEKRCRISQVAVDDALWNFALERGARDAVIKNAKAEITQLAAALANEPQSILLDDNTCPEGAMKLRFQLDRKQGAVCALLTREDDKDGVPPVTSHTYFRIKRLDENSAAIRQGQDVHHGVTMITLTGNRMLQGPFRAIIQMAARAVPTFKTADPA